MTRPSDRWLRREQIVPFLGAIAVALLVLNFAAFLAQTDIPMVSPCQEEVEVRVTAPAPPPAAPWLDVERVERRALEAERAAARIDRALQRAEARLLRVESADAGRRHRIFIAR